jgi:hypothetical protein
LFVKVGCINNLIFTFNMHARLFLYVLFQSVLCMASLSLKTMIILCMLNVFCMRVCMLEYL